jgi:hypothetical protein
MIRTRWPFSLIDEKRRKHCNYTQEITIASSTERESFAFNEVARDIIVIVIC